MDRDRSAIWFAMTGVVFPLAALTLGLSSSMRDNHAGAADQLLIATTVLAAVGIVCAVVAVVTRVRHPRIRFRTLVEDRGEEASMSLFRRDGQSIHDSRCRMARRRLHRVVRHSRPDHDAVGGVRPTFLYPNDFESIFIDGVLGKGRYAIVWETRLRNRRSGLMEWTRVARGRFHMTDDLHAAAERLRDRGTWLSGNEPRPSGARLWLTRRELPIGMTQCEVRRRHEDGTLGDAYAGHVSGDGSGEVALAFPDEFRREVGQTRHLTQGGGVQIDPQYENAIGEPGSYEVVWKAVWYVSGGTFEPDHEVTPEDFRREREVSQHRFQIAG